MWKWFIGGLILGYMLGVGSTVSSCEKETTFYKTMMLQMLKEKWNKK